MSLISITATIIDSEFANYYNDFMPLMNEILDNISMINMQQKVLRARTIDAIGYMIEAVSEKKEMFNSNVLVMTQKLITLMNSGLSNDDP